jgi:hypothetical protein
MSGQRHDACLFKKELYSSVWVEHGALFQPQDFGLRPHFGFGWRTDCLSGFHCYFGIGRDGLFLLRLIVHTEDGHYPLIDGVSSVFDDHESAHVYAGLRHRLSYSGKMRIAKDFIHEMYVHGGFQEETAFETVLEFNFRNGDLQDARDFSRPIAKRREALLKCPRHCD